MGKALVLRQQQLLESVVGKTNGGTTCRVSISTLGPMAVLTPQLAAFDHNGMILLVFGKTMGLI